MYKIIVALNSSSSDVNITLDRLTLQPNGIVTTKRNARFTLISLTVILFHQHRQESKLQPVCDH